MEREPDRGAPATRTGLAVCVRWWGGRLTFHRRPAMRLAGLAGITGQDLVAAD
ncbi:MAG: hypothetical protein ACXWU2_06850 [Allosphingosinicella sp.]